MWRIRGNSQLQEDDGATAVIVAILAVVLFGLAALAIDVGALFWERAQLQSGADAGSLAVAQDIASEVADGGDQPAEGDLGNPYLQTADSYADANAADGAATAESLQHTILAAHAGEVALTTLVSDAGEDELQHWFASLLGTDSSPVRAHARAIYGPLVFHADAFPFVACEDDYHKYWAQEEPRSPIELVAKIKGEEGEFGCGPNGNFQWIDQESNHVCTAALEVDDDITGITDPGANLPQGCTGDLNDIEAAIEAYDPSWDPDSDEYKDNKEARSREIGVFEWYEKDGKTEFGLIGLSKFVFTGVNLAPGGGQAAGTVKEGDEWDNPDCDDPDSRCVRGHFEGDLITAEDVSEIDPEAESDLLGVQLTE